MFNPSTYRVSARAVFAAARWNALVTAISTHLNNLTGADLAAPVVLSKTGQDLDGDGHYIYAFKRWLGTGGNVSLRDVCGFDAVGDGSTDDANAIQAAIDDLPTTGGVVLFPPGTYVIGEPIRMMGSRPKISPKTNVMLMGFGPATVIKLSSGVEDFAIDVGDGSSGMSIVNLKINGLKASNAAGGAINASRSTYCAILNTHFTNCVAGVDAGGSTALGISGCFFEGSETYDIYGTADKGPGTGLLIDGCHFQTSTDTSIDLTPGPSKLTISDCEITSPGNRGIRIAPRLSVSMTDISISGCTIRGAASNGIELRVFPPDVSLKGVSIGDNHIAECAGHGIEITSMVTGVSIHGNTIRECSSAGIRLISASKVTINDNVVMNNGQDSTSTLRDGISIGNSDHCTIMGNTCFDDQTGSETQEYGIALLGTTTACVVLGNSLSDNDSGGVVDGGTGNDVSHNAGQE